MIRKTQQFQDAFSSQLHPQVPCNPSQNASQLCCGCWQTGSLAFTWRGKRPRIANSVLKENKVRTLTLSVLKTYNRATSPTQCGTNWWKKKKTGPWTRVEKQEADPGKYSQLMADKGAQATQCRKTLSSTNGAGRTGRPHAEKKRERSLLAQT